MSQDSITRLRLQAQHITQADFEQPEDVVRHLLAMQAQDYPGALWSVGLRMKQPSLKAVEKAIAERKIVRTWPMRGTLHFLHADDARWMVDLLAPRVNAVAKSRRVNQLGLTDAVVAEAERVFRAELTKNKIIRRDAVAPLLAQKVRGLAITNQHTQHLMRNFGERGVLCFGPHDGKQPTFVLMDDWLPKTKPKDRDEALGELARRYFASHGPATLKDFAGWGYLTTADARKGLELAESELKSLVVSDTTYYLGRTGQPAGGSSVLLLPGFDEYMLGYKDRRAALATEHAQRIVPGNNGMFLPTIVLDGQIVGTWKRAVRKNSVTIIPGLFSSTTKLSPKELQAAIQNYGDFLGTEAALQA